MSDPIVIVGPDQRCYVTLEEHKRTRRKSAMKTACLLTIAEAMNKLADGLEKENSSLTDETRPAPLGD